MKKTIEIMKIAIILALAVIAIVCIFSEPSGETDWFINLLLYKAIGIASAFTAYKLTKCWKAEGLKQLDKFCSEQ